jgi:hypothetical protein
LQLWLAYAHIQAMARYKASPKWVPH